MTKTRKKVLSIPIAIALFLMLVGYFTRIQHWPYSFELTLLGLTSLGILYTSRYATKRLKTLKDNLKVLMVFSWVLVTILGLFKFGNLQYLIFPSLIIGLYWLIVEIIDAVNRKESNNNINPVLWIGIVLMIFSFLMKILHWPFGPIVYILALFISAVGFVLDYTSNRKGGT